MTKKGNKKRGILERAGTGHAEAFLALWFPVVLVTALLLKKITLLPGMSSATTARIEEGSKAMIAVMIYAGIAGLYDFATNPTHKAARAKRKRLKVMRAKLRAAHAAASGGRNGIGG